MKTRELVMGHVGHVGHMYHMGHDSWVTWVMGRVGQVGHVDHAGNYWLKKHAISSNLFFCGHSQGLLVSMSVHRSMCSVALLGYRDK